MISAADAESSSKTASPPFPGLRPFLSRDHEYFFGRDHQILALYRLLDHIAPNPMATVNRALAVAMVSGPDAGLDLLASLDGDERVSRHHRLYAMRGHLLELAGSPGAARDAFDEAARRTASIPEKRYLRARAEHCAAIVPVDGGRSALGPGPEQA